MFDSHNLYENINVIGARTPEALVKSISAITSSIKIISIVSSNNKHYCYFITDAKVQKRKDLPKAKIFSTEKL